MNPELPLSVMPLPEGYYFEIKGAPKHSIFIASVLVRKQGFPFSKIVAESGYTLEDDWEYHANTLSNELWAYLDKPENR